MTRLPAFHLGTRRGDVLTARRRGVSVVDDDRHAIVAIEYGVADATGEAVVPEPAVPHQGDRASIRHVAERRRTSRAETVAHDAGPHVERRQRGERMTANVCTDVHRAKLPLQQLHRSEQRPLGAAGAQAGRSRRHVGRQHRGESPLWLQRRLRHRRRWPLQQLRRMALQESTQTFDHHRCRVLARCGERPLSNDLRRALRTREQMTEGLLEELGLPLLHHEHCTLAAGKTLDFIGYQRIGDIQHVDRNL